VELLGAGVGLGLTVAGADGGPDGEEAGAPGAASLMQICRYVTLPGLLNLPLQ
jgi:hypothetical protein